LTTSGTRVICGAQEWQAVYVACLRNYRTQIAHIADHHPTVAVIGAGSRGQFREEDQLCCAWIAEGLLAAGYEPQNARPISIIEQWSGVPVDKIYNGASEEYPRNSGQIRDLESILAHVDGL